MKQNIIVELGLISLFFLAGFWGCLGDEPLPGDDENASGDSDSDSDGDSDTGTDTEECNLDGEPTWNDPVGAILSSSCGSPMGNTCHCADCSDGVDGNVDSYAGVKIWIENGKLETYVQLGSGHKPMPMTMAERNTVIHWLDIGAPEEDCDVESTQAY